ncbi:MAG TPA: NMD3-related protein [Methanobacterium sp.]|nr:NMD3-related protein [Methanobacterium sp.]
MFCIECGKENVKLYQGRCSSCFASGNKLITIPPDITVEFCAHCSSIHVGDKWVENKQPEEEIIAEKIVQESVPDENAKNVVLEIEPINQKGSILEMLVKASGTVLEVPIKKEFTLNVKLNRNVCPECSKHASGYYEAVLQLRGDKRPLDPDEIMRADEIIKKLLEKLFPKNRMAYLTQRIEIKEGIDYYFGSYKAARKVSNALKDQMGGVIGESPRLMGRDKSAGKDLYRIWISYRLPFFHKGDFIIHKKHAGQIIDINGKRILIHYLKTMNKISLSWREYSNLEMVAHGEDVKTTTVTSKTPTKIQLLHPETYQPIDLDILPEFSDINIGDQVKVVEILEKIYIIPPI